jgi:hypothetical protein
MQFLNLLNVLNMLETPHTHPHTRPHTNSAQRPQAQTSDMDATDNDSSSLTAQTASKVSPSLLRVEAVPNEDRPGRYRIRRKSQKIVCSPCEVCRQM